MTLQEILDLIQQQQSSGGQSAASPTSASVSPNTIGSTAGGAASLLGSGAGALSGTGGITSILPILGQGLTSLTGGPSRHNPVTDMSSQLGFGWLAKLTEDLGIPTISDLFGVPREAKTASLGQALQGTGNPLAGLVGQFINNGVAGGHVLSESGASTFGNSTETLASFLQALTGSQIPTVQGTGDFQKNPTFTPPGLGLSGSHFQLPAGYQFMDIQNSPQAAMDIEKIIGTTSTGGNIQGDWQKVIQQLIGQGALTKYQGALGSPGNAPTNPGNNPNVSLPHPLAQNRVQATPPPYPLEMEG